MPKGVLLHSFRREFRWWYCKLFYQRGHSGRNVEMLSIANLESTLQLHVSMACCHVLNPDFHPVTFLLIMSHLLLLHYHWEDKVKMVLNHFYN